jgi:hypothetical protein
MRTLGVLLGVVCLGIVLVQDVGGHVGGVVGQNHGGRVEGEARTRTGNGLRTGWF